MVSNLFERIDCKIKRVDSEVYSKVIVPVFNSDKGVWEFKKRLV
jgi:hypothetical protein